MRVNRIKIVERERERDNLRVVTKPTHTHPERGHRVLGANNRGNTHTLNLFHI